MRSLSLSEKLVKWDNEAMQVIFKSKEQENIKKLEIKSPFKTFSAEALRRLWLGAITFIILSVIFYSHYLDAKMTGVNYG
jgi:hypothetical protein